MVSALPLFVMAMSPEVVFQTLRLSTLVISGFAKVPTPFPALIESTSASTLRTPVVPFATRPAALSAAMEVVSLPLVPKTISPVVEVKLMLVVV